MFMLRRVIVLLAAAALVLVLSAPTAAQTHDVPLPDTFLFALYPPRDPVERFGTGPTDVAVGPDGSQYVADSENGRIQRFRANGEFISTWGSAGPGSGLFGRGPLRVAVDPDDGVVYVADPGNRLIQRFSPAGQYLYQWGVDAGYEAYLFGRPKDVVVSKDGTVLNIDETYHKIHHWGVFPYRYGGSWGSDGAEDGQFRNPVGIALSPNGRVAYVADQYRNDIQRFDPNTDDPKGAFLGKWGGDDGLAPDGGRDFIVDIAGGFDGTIYVAHGEIGTRVQRFSATGQYQSTWGKRGQVDGEIGDIAGIAAAPDGTVLLADNGKGIVQRFSSGGEHRASIGAQGDVTRPFYAPDGLAMAPDGSFYVSDTTNAVIQHFSAAGQLLHQWGSNGAADGQFQRPSGIAVAADGTVYVADLENNRIQMFTAGGQFLGKWGGPGTGDAQFRNLSDVAVAPDGTVYATDTRNRRVQHFSRTGDFLGTFPVTFMPRRLAIAPDGSFFIADRENHRIEHLNAAGQPIAGWGENGTAPGELNQPEGIAVSADGETIYVADPGNRRFQVFTPEGDFIGTVGSNGDGDGQFGSGAIVGNPSDVAVAADGTVYASDASHLRVQVFAPAYPPVWRAQFYTNRWLSEQPPVVTHTATIDYDWGEGAPFPGLPADGSSARFEQIMSFPEDGNYAFLIDFDGGARLWVDGRLLLDRWQPLTPGAPAVSYRLTQNLEAGYHTVRLEYNDAGGEALVRLRLEEGSQIYLPLAANDWQPPPPGPRPLAADG
jgi:DNA-binding beta-propeller fold protein YncE